MATPTTVGELRAAMTAAHADWTLDQQLKDNDPLPQHALGVDPAKVVKAASVPRVDIRPFLSAPTSNPFLQQQRILRGFMPAQASPVPTVAPFDPLAVHAAASAGVAGSAGGAGAASSVDWRNRFGWPWLTNIKDQDPCESCWCFGAVGVVEAMTRIEHTVWSLRSEGDVHDGMGTQCGTTGWPSNALDWMVKNGVADPGCWPYETANKSYAPTSDRDGRTVKVASYVTLSNVQDQKDWIDTIGPITACFDCYNDFFGYSSGVYKHVTGNLAGGHCIIIVGYDDTKQAWLIRNSWGTGWGMSGYGWFGYGQCNMDANAKYGVANTALNPDPWTKRRAHNGNFYESGDGALNRNFEVWALAPKCGVRHYWRDGTSLNWAVAETEGADCETCPTVTGTTYNRNFEYVYQTINGRLHHRYFDQATGQWGDGGVFGPTNVAGVPGFIQSDYNAPGNFEVVVMVQGGTLVHWWRLPASPWTWQQSAAFGSGVAHSGRTLVQRFDHGLDVVVANTDGTLQRYGRADGSNTWAAAEKFASGVKSPPVMIQGQYGASEETTPGNYELCVAVNGQIQHWWKTNTGNGTWAHSATFGASVTEVVGLIESSYGFNLELVALLQNGGLQHFWRDGSGWHAGPVFGSTVH